MAVLSKIRERSMFLIIIIGLALFAFVLDPSQLGDFFNSSKINEVGEIDGESISRQEFANELEAYKQQTGGRVSEMQAAKTVWNNLVRKKIYTNQLEEAGITIGEADVWNELISAPFVQNNPQYQNELGLFDESKFKQFLANEKDNKTDLWGQWSKYMGQIKGNLETTAYNNLVTAGLGASLKEGETEYFVDNTKINAQFVYVPYTSVADSLIKLKKSDVQAYIDDHQDEFKVEESRDISYVKFDINATEGDEEVIKGDVASLIDDLKSATDASAFIAENGSDTPVNSNFQFKNILNQENADMIYAANKDEVVGPYKDKSFYKISKITEVTEMPDSVRASHILIAHVGAQRVLPEVTRTEEEAKELADSLFTVIKRNRRKFEDLAKEFSTDKGSAEKGGDLDWFNYNRMTPAFRDYCFENKKGDIDVVKSPFGYHIIRIDNQKNKQKVVKLATFSRKIVPSEETENSVYRKAEQFALEVSKDGKFFDAAKSNDYKTKPAVGLKSLDENVPGLGNQRQIVSWAFAKDTEIGDFKRFDLEGSYVVAFVTGSADKGLMTVGKATNRVRPILMNQKKAELIKSKLEGTSLQEIAKANNISLRTASNVTLKSPTLSGVGVEPKIVGAMYLSEENKLYTAIEGSKGVFSFKVTKRELPTALPNYDGNRKRIVEARKRLTYKMYEAIKKSTDIEDNRAVMYGSN